MIFGLVILASLLILISIRGNNKKELGVKKALNRYQSFLIIRLATTYSPGCYPSTISATGLNFSVRNGKR